MSSDAGKTVAPIITFTTPNGETNEVAYEAGLAPLWFDPQQRHREFGQYFYPCAVPADPAGYFGHYVAGTFRDDIGTSYVAVSWADSRRGCLFQDSGQNTCHQHVYAQGQKFP